MTFVKNDIIISRAIFDQQEGELTMYLEQQSHTSLI